MNKWILQLFRKIIKFIFKVCFGITADEFNMGKLILITTLSCHGIGFLFFISLFILLEEVSELFIVFKLLFLHRRDLMNMLLEVFEMVHEYFLLFNELVYILSILSQLLLWHIVA